MGRHAGPVIPLTDERRDLAGAYFRWTRKLVGPMVRLFPRLGYELESAACLALLEAARTFDPARNVKFATFARYRIWGEVRKALRDDLPRGFGRRPDEHPSLLDLADFQAEDAGTILLSEPDSPPGAGEDLAETIAAMLKRIPRRHAEVIRLIYFEGLTRREAADRIGLAPSGVARLHDEALVWLRWEADWTL